ncbi:ABC transporter substrate-binding protein [Microbacterium resistens]
MRKPFRSALVAGLAVLALTVAGCSSQAPAAADGTAGTDAPEGLTPVTYLTSFNTFGRDAYAYVALEKGFFEDAGFEVEIQPGSGTVDVLKLVASGKADFGVGDFQAAALTIANEQIPARIVSAIQDKSLAAIATAEGYGISQPKDLEGKKIADQPGSVNEVLFPVYAEAAGIDASTVTFVPAQPSALPQLLASKQVDAIGQFVVADGLIRGATGEAGVFLPFSDYLEDLYGNALFASEKRVADDPESITRFNEALHRGLAYAIENPEETGEILAKYQPTQKPDVAAGEVEAMTPYVGDPTGNGLLDPARVDAILALLVEGGAITSEPDASAIVAPVE